MKIINKLMIIAGLIFTVLIAVNIIPALAPDDERLSAAFREISCPVIEREYLDKTSYTGPLIDTHIHMPSIPESAYEKFDENNKQEHPIMGINTSIANYVCMMDSEQTTKVFAFFPVWDPIIQESLDVVKKTMEKYPDRFVPFIMPPDHDDRADGFPTVNSKDLAEMLSIYPGLFKGYGEIGLYERGDHGGPKGAPALPPDSQRLLEIYPVIKENNLLVYVHLGEGQKESFEHALKLFPEINFIWHGDQLIHNDENGEQVLDDIEAILSAHPNAYYGVDELYGDTWLLRPEVSKEEFLAHFINYEPLLKKDLKTWKDFIERHPDQVLWGTDRGWSTVWSLDQDIAITLNNYSRAFIGRLDPSVQEKFAYKNAEALINE